MNIKTFKTHPTMIIRLIKPYLFVLIFPFARSISQIITKNEFKWVLPYEIVLLGLVLIFVFFRWFSTKISINCKEIIVKRGFLLKSCSCIDLSDVSSISLKQNIIDLLFCSVGCSVNTEAGTPNKDDFYFKLRFNDAKTLYNTVCGDEHRETIKFPSLRIALLAAATSSATTGIFAVVPIINYISNLVGIALSDVLLHKLSDFSLKLDSLFPPVVNMITIVFFILYGVSFLAVFIKNAKFRLKIGKNAIEIQSGLLVRKKTIFKKTNINNVCIEQTAFMRLIKKHSMRISVGGYGDKKGTSAVIIPVAHKNELKEHLKMHFSFLKNFNGCIKGKKTISSLKRLLFIPTVLALVIIGLAWILTIFFPQFTRLVLFLGLVGIFVDAYYGSVCYYNYNNGTILIKDGIYISGAIGLTIRELYCNKTNVGIIKITETPADRRFGTCKIKIIIRSEDADTVKVKNIGKKAVFKQINNTFGLNSNE